MSRKGIAFLIVMLIISSPLTGNDRAPFKPVNTFSIVCFDPETGQFGAAVQSHYFKVADVIWLEPGVGAVATQSMVDFAYGPIGLEMMEKGRTAEEALAGCLASDPDRDFRQVAMIDRMGIASAHTGLKCIAEAGHLIGENFSVQANLMKNATVWGAMANAFKETEGDLAEKMMAALEAAQAEGGDIRGKQSAAMVVVSGEPTGQSWRDRIIDIRVDDSPKPLEELRRLLNISRAYKHMDEGDNFITLGDFEAARQEYKMAAELAPGNVEIKFWYAVTLATEGELKDALPVFKEVFEEDPVWRELVSRLVPAGILPDEQSVIDQILEQ